MIGGPVGAQWGFMIGSLVGSEIDPQKIEGPRLTDAQTQLSNEGVPRTIIYGTCAAAGNIVQVGPLVEHKKKERQGKGGPVVTTYTYTRTVAFRICEAAPNGGTMRLGRVWKDDKLVADFTSANSIPADTAAFNSILTFYTGAEDQLPDPSLEALPTVNGGGVGNVPAYRGSCYAVLTDLDCTDRQGAVPQFRFEVCSEGTQDDVVTQTYVGPDYSRFTNNPNAPLANPETDYTISTAGGEKISGSYTVTTSSIAAGILQADDYYVGWGTPSSYVGVLKGGAGPYSTSAVAMEGHGANNDLTRYKQVQLLYSWKAPIAFQDAVKLRGGSGGSSPTSTAGEWNGDALGVVFRSYTSHDATTAQFGLTGTEGFKPHYVVINAKKLVPEDKPQPGEFLLPDIAGYVSDAAGNIRKLGGTATLQAGLFRTLALENAGTTTYTTRELGPVRVRGAADDTQANWDADYVAAVAAGEMPAGMTYSAAGTGGSTTYPRNTTAAYQLGSGSTTVVTPGSVALGDIVTDLCGRAGIDTTQVDVTALAGITVRGFPIARQTTAAEAIRALQQVFLFDLPEWGNSGDTQTKLRAVLRGGATVLTLTDDDLVESDDDEDTRAQQVEVPRKLSVTAADPTANYEPVTESAERESENVKAVGEQQISTAVVLVREEIAQLAEKLQKLVWEQAAGRINREVPEAFTAYTPSDPIAYNGRRYRLDKVELRDGSSAWELVRDRAGAYSSTATGGTPLSPTPPVSSMRGPTMFAGLNLQRLRSQDTTPGMYVFVSGLLPGWVGCDLYLSVDDGVTEQLVTTLVDAATMGTLSADLTDTGTTLSVSLYDGELDSATAEQLLARRNAAAVTTAGVSEILQFQTATETAAEAYDLTDLARGGFGTAAADHYATDGFVLLDGAVTFLPLDISLAGKTLIFRPVSIGTAPANNATYSVVFKPKFTGPQVVEAYTDDAGNAYTDDAGNAYYYEVPST